MDIEALRAAFDDETVESLVREQTRTCFVGELPPDFAFFTSCVVVLAFEHLGLSEEEERELFWAFATTGVVVPGTHWRLRCLAPLRSVVELADGSEKATLPSYWKECLLRIDRKVLWVGKRVLDLARCDLTGYRDVGEGLEAP